MQESNQELNERIGHLNPLISYYLPRRIEDIMIVLSNFSLEI